ncbi:MAG: ribonuclease HII [Puniceicoccaceae bacterium 5H]|nr:MAG: ribonuclease HII [Puniceicoccaceae bacterium 5H]
MSALKRHDRRRLRDCAALVGVDEAGRGALAGPVVAGAVLVDTPFLDGRWCRKFGKHINDSKQLTPALREELFDAMRAEQAAGGLVFSPGIASVEEIAALNILGATRLAMQRALEAVLPHAPALCPEGCVVLLDGKPMRPFPYAHEALVKGDGKCLAIALGSIIAKVTRDREMVRLHAAFPHYGWAEHKGYAVPAHRDAILTHGPCAHHRELFLRKLLHAPEQAELDLVG